MKNILLTLFSFLFCAEAGAQGYLDYFPPESFREFLNSLDSLKECKQHKIYEGEYINCVDTSGLKQGHWIIFASDKKPIPANYAPDCKYEEGNYKDSKKTGVWISYYPSQNKKSEITFANNKAKGYAKMYYDEEQVIQEEGTWENGRWVGTYKMYHPNGCIYYQWNFSKTGKKEGEQKYYYSKPCNALWMIGTTENGKETGEWISYDVGQHIY